MSSKAMGFEGMGCIHPRQIAVIRQGFAPDSSEIEKSKEIVKAFEEAEASGLGVVALGSKMIDAPVVMRARRTLNLAHRLGLIPDNKMDEDRQKENQ
jgi:citrate lyase subunit beta/citryl-CoA lyase